MPSVEVEREAHLYIGEFPFNAELNRGEIGPAAWFNLLIVWRTQREEIERRTDEEIWARKTNAVETLRRLREEQDALEARAREYLRGGGGGGA